MTARNLMNFSTWATHPLTSMRIARIARPRLRRSSTRAAFVAAFIGAPAATIFIEGAGECEPSKEQNSGPHRTRVRCTTDRARWPDCSDDRHRAGESQNWPAEPCLQYPPARDA